MLFILILVKQFVRIMKLNKILKRVTSLKNVSYLECLGILGSVSNVINYFNVIIVRACCKRYWHVSCMRHPIVCIMLFNCIIICTFMQSINLINQSINDVHE